MQTTTIQQKYDAFIKRCKTMPKVVEVTIEWKDNHERHNYLISLDDCWADGSAYPYRNTKAGLLTEEDIFYHAGSMKGLYDLIASDGEDFKILDVIDFY